MDDQKRKYIYHQEIPLKDCANCGDEFKPSRTTARFCSKACAEADAMINHIKQAIHRDHQIEEALQ